MSTPPRPRAGARRATAPGEGDNAPETAGAAAGVASKAKEGAVAAAGKAKEAAGSARESVGRAASTTRTRAAEAKQTLTPDAPPEETAQANKDALAALARTAGRRTRDATSSAAGTVAEKTRGAVSIVKEEGPDKAKAVAATSRDATSRGASTAAGAAGGMTRSAAGSVRERLAPDVDLERLAERVLKIRGVTRLAPDASGRAGGLLPGHVAGTRVDDDSLTVRIVARYGERLAELAERVHKAAKPFAAGRSTHVEVADLDLPDPAT